MKIIEYTAAVWAGLLVGFLAFAFTVAFLRRPRRLRTQPLEELDRLADSC